MLLDYFDLYRTQLLAGAVALIAAVILAIAFWGDVFKANHVPLACLLLDTSGSTRTAFREYSQLARNIVTRQSDRDGNVCFIPVEGDPAADSSITDQFVGGTGNSSGRPLVRLANQTQMDNEIDAVLQNPVQHIPGSALIEAFSILARVVRPGDTIYVFSDGLQQSKAFTLRDLLRDHFSPVAIESELDQLHSQGLLPVLGGVKIIFETPGYRPGAARSVVPDPDAELFWKDWGVRVKAPPISWGPAQ